MKSPYRISAKEPEVDGRPDHVRSYAVYICIALGVIVQLVGLLTHSLDAFGHVAFAFAFGLGTAGLQAGVKSAQPLHERSDGTTGEDEPRRVDAPPKERSTGKDGEPR